VIERETQREAGALGGEPVSGGRAEIEEMCAWAGVSRASYYRHWRASAPREEETEVRSAVQRVALEWRSYGYRKVHAALRVEGYVVNHKRVLRLMQEDNLLSIRKRKYVVTTDSRHEWRAYPNQARGLAVTATNQLWVADITYLRLREEFVYLAVVLDAWSRKAVGWALSRTIDTALTLKALSRALEGRNGEAPLVHHSDRGVQYASQDYVTMLEANDIVISMSRVGNPWDNAYAETFMKTLKTEEGDGRQYRTMEEAEQSIDAFIGSYYNQQRLHQALGYQTPVEFEQAEQERRAARSALRSALLAAPHSEPMMAESSCP
jgi:putative transposase